MSAEKAEERTMLQENNKLNAANIRTKIQIIKRNEKMQIMNNESTEISLNLQLRLACSENNATII